jgi:hypothetical protein
MLGEIVLIAVAGAATMVTLVSAQRGIEELALERANAAKLNRRRVGERVDAVYRSLEAQLGSEPRGVAAVAAGSSPVAADADVAVAFLRRHLGSASEDEVQRLLPMLQLLQQRALERAAALHPPVIR